MFMVLKLLLEVTFCLMARYEKFTKFTPESNTNTKNYDLGQVLFSFESCPADIFYCEIFIFFPWHSSIQL